LNCFEFIVLQEVKQEIDEMMLEAATLRSDEDDGLSDDTVEGGILV